MLITNEPRDRGANWFSDAEDKMYAATTEELHSWTRSQGCNEGEFIDEKIQHWFRNRAEGLPNEQEMRDYKMIATVTHFGRVAKELDDVYPRPKPDLFASRVKKFADYKKETGEASDTGPYALALEIFNTPSGLPLKDKTAMDSLEDRIAEAIRVKNGTYKIANWARRLKRCCHCEDTSTWGLTKNLLARYEAACESVRQEILANQVEA